MSNNWIINLQILWIYFLLLYKEKKYKVWLINISDDLLIKKWPWRNYPTIVTYTWFFHNFVLIFVYFYILLLILHLLLKKSWVEWINISIASIDTNGLLTLFIVTITNLFSRIEQHERKYNIKLLILSRLEGNNEIY